MSPQPPPGVRPDTHSRRFADHLTLFWMDAARWVVPGQLTPPDSVTTRQVLTLLVRYRSLRAMAWFRLASWCKHGSVRGVGGIIQRRMARVYGLDMVPGNDIGGGLYIAHPVGVTIVCSRIGVNASFGGLNTVDSDVAGRWPRLGDHVRVAPGAKILGDLEIGDDTQIAPNAVVLDDVPAGETGR